MQLTLDDLVRWKPGRFRPAEAPARLREELAIELSWAAMIRTTAPVLPPMRGGELVVVPGQVLAELYDNESIGWRDVLAQLRTLGVSGVVTDAREVLALSPGLTVIESVEPLHEDFESLLNREIIERRGELYQLGSELARELSAASIRGASLESLLRIAESIGGVPVALLAGSGAVLAASQEQRLPAGLPFDPERLHIPIPQSGLEWVCHPVSSPALPEGVVLVGGIEPEQPADRARLILEQTAESLGMVFDRLPPVDVMSPQREIEQLLEQILINGSITPVARRRFARLAEDFQIGGQLRLVAEPDAADTSTEAPLDLGMRHDGMAYRVVGDDGYQQRWSDGPPAVISAPVSGIDGLTGLLAPVSHVARLMRAGVITERLVDLGRPEGSEAPVTLLLVGLTDSRAGQMLRAFAAARLEAFDEYDRQRGSELVRTLDAYLQAGATIAAASRDLGIHRNTLAYRIARIEELGDFSLADPAMRFDLELALSIRKVLGQPVD